MERGPNLLVERKRRKEGKRETLNNGYKKGINCLAIFLTVQ